MAIQPYRDSFELDSNSDGLADNWGNYSALGGGTVTHTLSSNIVDGVYAQNVHFASGATPVYVGIYRRVPCESDIIAFLSIWTKLITGTVGIRAELVARNAAYTYIGGIGVNVTSGSYTNVKLRMLTPALTAWLDVNLRSIGTIPAGGTIGEWRHDLAILDVESAIAPSPLYISPPITRLHSVAWR
jgi:hypothetical protein